MPNSFTLSHASSGRPPGTHRTDEVDGVADSEETEDVVDDFANEAPVDVGFDTDDDGDSAPDGYSSGEEE